MPTFKYRDPGSGLFVPLLGSGITQTDADARYLIKSGDAMTGQLVLPDGLQATNFQAASKYYVDSRERHYGVEPTATSWNDITQPGPYNNLMYGTTNPNGPGIASYYYVTNYIYSGTNGVPLPSNHTNNMTQYAIPYGPTNGVSPPAYRHRYSNVWGAWINMLTDASATAATYRGIYASWAATTATVYNLNTAASFTDYTVRDITRSAGTFTIAKAGIYSMSLAGKFSGAIVSTARGFCSINIGARIIRGYVGNADTMVTAACTMGFNAGGTFTLDFYQSSGSTLTVSDVNIHVVRVADL